MPYKKKRPDEAAHKRMQTFFCVDAFRGPALAFNLGYSVKTVATPACN